MPPSLGENYHNRNSLSTMADYADLHELAKGWKAAIVRATDPATK